MRPARRSLITLAIVGAVMLSACGGTVRKGNAPVAASDTSAVTFQRIPGTSVRQIVLSRDAAYRIGIQTQPIERAPGNLERIPYAAVMYTPDGGTYAYMSPSRLTYQRVPVTIARIAGDMVYLRGGPAVGTQIVTVGSDELLGTEEGVQDEEATLRNAPPELRPGSRSRGR